MLNKFKLNNILGLAVIVAIILAIIFLISNSLNNSNTDSTNQPSTNATTLNSFELIPVTSLNQIKLDSKTINLSSNFIVNSIIKANTYNNFTCNDNKLDLCTVYQLSNGQLTYYLSIPAYIKFNSESFSNPKEIVKTFIHNGVTYYATYVYLELYNEDDTVVENEFITTQVYICTEDKYCLSSGLLNITDLSTNKNQVKEFVEVFKKIV